MEPVKEQQLAISQTKIKISPPIGILRLEMGGNRLPPRRLSGELKVLTQGEPTSPQPSIDRLSVTFADDSCKSNSDLSQRSLKMMMMMDKVHFPPQPSEHNEDSDGEDYSASVNAIFQRRASMRRSRRRSGRRTSSPFSPDILPGPENGRRRSSVFTTSSGDTAITMDENVTATQEEIFENIKLHKEVLSNVKMQPWNMRKKLKLVIQAKSYIKKHEGALQERLAQSRSTKDMLARWNILLIKKWQKYRREMANVSNWFIPWELKIKEIESHFGSVVASYFIFLRWLFWVNVVLAIVLISFVAVPEMLMADWDPNDDRKFTLPEEKYNSTNFLTLWDFEGVLKYSPLFYGWYTSRDSNMKTYRLPFAYFVTGLVAYAYSFFATLRKMAENSRMSKLSEKDDECIFSWKLFTAWDYMIGNPETAHNRVASIVVGFKEALLEEAEKKRQSRNWKIIAFRIMVNTIVLGLLSFSAFAVVMVVKRSTEPEATSTVWRRNEITVVMSLISLFFPMLFEVFGFLEQYHPRKQLRIQLARIMVLNLLNLYSLIFALFDKINDMTTELEEFRNHTLSPPPPLTPLLSLLSDTDLSTAPATAILTTQCHQLCVDYENNNNGLASLNEMIAALVVNISMITSTISSLYNSNNNNETITINNLDFTTTIGVNNNNNNSIVDDEAEIYDNLTIFNNNTIDGNFSEINQSFDDFHENFIDYLTLILSQFSGNESFNNDNNNNNTTSISTSVTDTPNSTFEYFKTTTTTSTTPGFNVTEGGFDVRSNNNSELTTILDEIVIINKTNCSEICETVTLPNSQPTPPSSPYLLDTNLNYSTRSRLRSLCWETMFGQELIKLTVMDLIFTALTVLTVDFLRGLFVRFMNRCWCWDLEKKFPQYGDFKVAENILHLVNNQGMVWMGMFFSPGLVVINVIKLYIMMYLRAWAVLTCNVPHEIIFRASRSNNFYYALLLMMLFLCVLPVGYAIVWIRPSWHCGPFSKYTRIFHIFTTTIKNNVPEIVQKALDYIASPGIVIPLLVLLILIIYYLVSLTGALREANNDLKIQLRRERTEERRKMFQIADKRRRQSSSGSGGEFANTPFAKWKKLLNNMPEAKSFDDTPKQDSTDLQQQQQQQMQDEQQQAKEEKTENKSLDFFSKLIKRALGKSSTTSDEEQNNDDGTDTEQQESLPDDLVNVKEIRPQVHRTVTRKLSNIDLQKVVLQKRNSNGSPRTPPIGILQQQQQQSIETRQDSSGGSSGWSDNIIPVITISKTESAEYLNRDKNVDKKSDQEQFKPKIKYALKKQDSEIDEDAICYFNKNINVTNDDNIGTKSESSEDTTTTTTTTKDGSVDTVLKRIVEEGNTPAVAAAADEPNIGYSESTL